MFPTFHPAHAALKAGDPCPFPLALSRARAVACHRSESAARGGDYPDPCSFIAPAGRESKSNLHDLLPTATGASEHGHPVAAGVPPAVKPGILPGAMGVPTLSSAPPGGRMPHSTARDPPLQHDRESSSFALLGRK